jgi:predicted ATPase
MPGLYRACAFISFARVPQVPSAWVTGGFQPRRRGAPRQQARSLELRAATDLARLWMNQGKHAEALDLLSSIYGRFAEGFETGDLKEAAALLTELQGQLPKLAG